MRIPQSLGSLLVLLLGTGCASVEVKREESPARGASALAEARAEMIQTDAAFSQMSAAQGMAAAFLAYYAPDGVMLPANAHILRGRDAVREHLNGSAADGTLTWQPLAAEVAHSGDLGYTYGVYEFRQTDDQGLIQVSHGKYVTIWKRQHDGSWKIALDGGNPSPGPEPAP